MFNSEMLSDTEDFIPRNAPRPTMNNSDKCAVNPAVPEVSLVFDVPVANKNQRYPDYHNITERPPAKPTPVLTINPTPPRAAVPELSLIINQNDPIPQTTKSDMKPSTQSQMYNTKPKSSLPNKSFSNFKLEYGSLISSMENKTRKSVQFQSALETENSENSSRNSVEYDSNPSQEFGESVGSIMYSSTNSCHCQKLNDAISEKLDSLTTLIQSLFVEIKDVKSEIRELRTLNFNNSEPKDSAFSVSHESFTVSNVETDTISDLETEIKQNHQQFSTADHKNIENTLTNPNEMKSQLQKPVSMMNKKESPSRSCLLKNIPNHLETLPESVPLLVFSQDVNRSLAMNKLAEKYLTEDKYKVYVEGNCNCIGNTKLIDCMELNRKCTDMSIGTYDYMKKYKLIPEVIEDLNDDLKVIARSTDAEGHHSNQNVFFFRDIKKGPKFI